MLGNVFKVSAVALLVGAIVWLVWKNRHAFLIRGFGRETAVIPPTARVVMGMEVSPETLPADVPAAAWALWQQGRHQEALGLALSRRDFPGDRIGARRNPGIRYRGRLPPARRRRRARRRIRIISAASLGAWSRLAYAGRRPEERDVDELCQPWPFGERRDG